jgi:hypothetical protein
LRYKCDEEVGRPDCLFNFDNPILSGEDIPDVDPRTETFRLQGLIDWFNALKILPLVAKVDRRRLTGRLRFLNSSEGDNLIRKVLSETTLELDRLDILPKQYTELLELSPEFQNLLELSSLRKIGCKERLAPEVEHNLGSRVLYLRLVKDRFRSDARMQASVRNIVRGS